MKKAIFASIIMLATLTACNSSETANSSEETQNQTFQSKTAARGEGEELPALTPEQEKVVTSDAMEVLKSSRESELNGDAPVSDRRAIIICHSNYAASTGHACALSPGGYLTEVTWGPEQTQVGGSNGPIMENPTHTVYHGTLVPRCTC